MLILRQSTASQEVLIGPLLDDTDGKSAETGLTINASDIKIWKFGATSEADKNSGGATHIAAGRYYAVLDATDTDTVGSGEINVHVSGALPVKVKFQVLEEAVYDAFFAASAAGYQVPIWSSASATVNLSGTTVKTLTDAVTLPTIPNNWIAAAGIAADAFTAAKFASDVTTEFQSGLSTLDAAGVRTAVGLASANLDTQLAALPTAAENAAAVADEFATASDAVEASPSPTTTAFEGSNSLSDADDFYNGSVLMFTSGDLDGLARKIADYTGTTRLITVSPALPSAPSAGDTFRILGRID